MSDGLMQDAVAAHQAGRLAEAAELYRRVLSDAPAHFGAMYSLGVASLQMGEFEQAQDIIGEALKLNPRYSDGWCARGTLLVRLGRLEQALACLDQALALKPDFPEALSMRAVALREAGRFADALAVFDRLLVLFPNHADTWNNRGSLCLALDRYDDALESYDRALAIKPDFLEARINQATTLNQLDRLEEALAGFDAVLKLDPKNAFAWNNRGNALMAMKRFEDALASFERALAIQPNFPDAADNRESALLELKRVTRCPPGYLRSLFDDFSGRYDQNMLNVLGYRAHLDLRAFADRILPRKAAPLRILDLGTGTGLVGESFKDLAAGGRFDGIDLAPRMIEASRARGIYDDLILGDLETVLAGPGPSYDLVLSADTMIYIGDLGPTFRGVFKRLEPGGFYLFACESKRGEGWEQTPAKRFRHSEAYIREEAARAGLVFLDIMECTLRREANEPMPGFTVALKKPD